MMQVGTRVDGKTVIARWGFGEFRAPRWVNKYARFEPEKIRAGIAFDTLTHEERDHLEYMTRQYRGDLVSDIDAHPTWEGQAWDKDRFGRVLTIVRMAPNRNSNIPFLSFIACPRFLNADGTLEAGDPRTEADKVPFDTPFVQDEPVVVTPKYGPPILIEGYGRGVLFMRSNAPDATIKVWYPV